MTTEIAVINRLGVALATDSAVTISGDQPKVFDTGDKLFELCEHAPIGVMINGNMDLLGVPWEIIIKDFRRDAEDGVKTIRQWLQALLDFASQHKAFSETAERSYLVSLAIEELDSLKPAISRRVFQAAGDEDVPSLVQSLLRDEAARRAAVYKSLGRAESLKGIKPANVLAKHGAIIDEWIDQRFAPVPVGDEARKALQSLICEAVLSQRPTGAATGVIVAGYGEADMFPSLAMADVDGAICGKIKYSHGESLSINRSDNPGKVISFAQTDVVERLLSGADSQFVDKSAEFISASLINAQSELDDLFAKLGADASVSAGVMEEIAAAVAEEHRTSFAKSARAQFESNFNDMVALMPKRDVIELAEALVSITAIERKASSEQATVGGPVDVAFITRHEGFVWIKRKHYFDADLNPRYFWRKFRLAKQGEPV